jgi:indolepyruvate decarboxylase
MSTRTVAEYLLDRLAEAGVRHLFGVPGDFTLGFLDVVDAHPVIEWVGCANELGAGYAADGYARVAGLGALSTTFGVGELSAIAAVAGSFAEHVPVVHLVGAPTIEVQAAGRATHHTLGDGDFGHFARMSAEVTATQAVLSAENAVREIDRVVAVALERRRPVYLLLPADVVDAPVQRPASHTVVRAPRSDPGARSRFREAVEARLRAAARVAVLADILVQRLGAESNLHELLATGVPHATLLWGRRVVDEAAPSYLGSYLGAASAPRVRRAIEEADLLITAGVQFTDLTSGFFSQHLPAGRTIEIGGEAAYLGGEGFAPLTMADALDVVAAAIRERSARIQMEPTAAGAALGARETAGGSAEAAAAAAPAMSPPLDQRMLWKQVARSLAPGDMVIADQGTSYYGMADQRLPSGVTFIGQPLWAAIGYTLPALLGVALAAPARRPVLLIGDGAAQLTIGELGTLLRRRIPAIVVLVDNAGYTIERVIHGPEAAYNDIAGWDWVRMIGALGGRAGVDVGVRVETEAELELALEAARQRPGLSLIQAMLPLTDVPPVLSALAAEAAAANRAARR